MDYRPSDEAASICGFDAPAATVEVTYTSDAGTEQTVTLTIGGESIGTVDLIAGSDVARNQMLYTISRVGEFFSSTYFKVVIMLTMAVVAVYAFVWVLSILGVWSRESEDKS